MPVNAIDYHYMKAAMYLAANSACLRRKIGCVLVGGDAVLSADAVHEVGDFPHIAGCNSPALKVDCVSCVRGDYASGEGYELCPAVHAEAAVICKAAAEGFVTDRAVLYSSTTVPCKWCAGLIVRAGIGRVVCVDEGEEKIPDIQVFGEKILRQHEVELVKVDWGEGTGVYTE